MNKTECPSCKNTVEIQEETKLNELITCTHCKSVLELIDKYPPTLDWAEDPAISSRRLFSKMY